MLQQELTAYLNLSEESPIFLKFMEGLKLNQSITNDFFSNQSSRLQRT
jgi:hypothetical protein